MEPALAVARLPEGGEKRALLAQDPLRDQLADAQHLVAEVGIRDHVAVLSEAVQDGEGVGREAADRPEERRLRKECARTSRSRVSQAKLQKHTSSPSINSLQID